MRNHHRHGHSTCSRPSDVSLVCRTCSNRTMNIGAENASNRLVSTSSQNKPRFRHDFAPLSHQHVAQAGPCNQNYVEQVPGKTFHSALLDPDGHDTFKLVLDYGLRKYHRNVGSPGAAMSCGAPLDRIGKIRWEEGCGLYLRCLGVVLF